MTAEALREPASIAETPHRLYRFFDGAGRLLYVGITDDLGVRWKSHMRSKDWWADVRSCTVEVFPTRAALEAAEIVAIKTEKPIHNVLYNRGHAASVQPQPRTPGVGARPKPVPDRLARWLETSRLSSFTHRQAFKALSGGGGGGVRVPSDVTPTLDHFEAVGYIKRAPSGRSDSTRYEVSSAWNFRC